VVSGARESLARQFLRIFPGKEAMSDPPLTIRLFGPLEVRLRGQPLPRLRTRKVAWTFALLVLRRDRAVEREWLAGTLWPESAADRAHYNLRRGLSELRRALGPEAWRITTPNRHAVSLDLSGADVDLVGFDEAIGRADAASLAQAVAVYGGPLLEGCTEEWVLPEREAREQAVLGALERLALESLESGDPGSAVTHLRRAVAVDSLRESAQRLLLEALAAGGEYGEAVQSYRALRLLLWEELRTEPAPETRAVYERIRAQAGEHAARDASRARPEARPSAVPAVASLPPIWNVPHRRNPNFVGREALLLGIEATLAGGGPAALTQAMVGLGGIGKTQCALEYAYRHAGDYQTVWWVRAEEPAQLAADYAALASPLGLPEKATPDQRTIVGAVRAWLERNGGWLLIFDNVPDPQAVMDYLPRAGGGHALITSRSQNWGRTATAVVVPVLPQEEAVSFLEQRTGWSGPEVGVLAEELGQLPLALEQAAAYAEATGCGASAYLALFRSRRRELLQHGGPPEGYQGTVATTWRLAIAELAAHWCGPAQLLCLCAYLAPDEIPLSLAQEGAEFYPEPLATAAQDPLLLHDAVAALRRYSLVTIDQEALTVHRLVQAVVRDGLSEEEQRAWATAAVRLVSKGFPGWPDEWLGDVRTWARAAPRLPHALACLELAVPLGVAADDVMPLFDKVGWYLIYIGDRDQGRLCLERSVEVAERDYGPAHEMLIDRLRQVAQARGHSTELYARALDIAEKALGPEHPRVVECLVDLGDALIGEDDARARDCYLRGLTIAEAVEGPGGKLVSRALGSLALVLVALGDLKGAKAAAERALAIAKELAGRGYWSVKDEQARHVGLAVVLAHMADFAGERQHLEQALEIEESIGGPDSLDVGWILSDLTVWLALGDTGRAKEYGSRVLAVMEKAYGPSHPWVAYALCRFAELLQVVGEPAAAVPLLDRALAILQDKEGPDAAAAAHPHRVLGSVLLDLRDVEAAAPHLLRAVALQEGGHGQRADALADILPDLGRLRRMQGDLAGAEACLTRSLAIPEDVCPPHQTRMAATHLEYGLTLQAEGDLAGAREHLTQAVALSERQLGPLHPRTDKARRALAALDPESVTPKRRRASRPPRAC
jgi:DNA-binding SARP family transcriptional activator